MKTRNLGVTIICIAVLLSAGLMGISNPAYAQSPTMDKWVDALPVPPVATETFKPLISWWADYYEINMTASQHQFNSSLGPATVWTYGQPGKTPVLLGPTIVAKTGRPVVIKWINDLPTALADFPLLTSIDPTIVGAPGFNFGEVPPGAAIPHLHGGHTAARFDGTPEQWWTPDGIKGPDYKTDTFTYLNEQSASLVWYHDHTLGATRFKPYLGLAAAYLILDDIDNGSTITVNGPDKDRKGKLIKHVQKVPAGYGIYHLPLVIQDKQFNDNGTLFYPTVADGGSGGHPIWVPEFFGDTPVINGKAYPYLDAQPRRYRLRLLNGSQARFYNLGFKKADNSYLTFYVIGSEGGLLPAPAAKTKLLISPGERFDVIVDFTGIAVGSTVMMTNDAPAPYPMGDPANDTVPELMQININTALVGTDDTVLPATLALPAIPRLTATPGLPPRDVVAKENSVGGSPSEMLLNGYHFLDPTTDFIKAGTTEIWQWINLTVDAHPMHPHLVAFQVLNRQKFDVVTYRTDWAAYLEHGRTDLTYPKPDINGISSSSGFPYLVGDPIPPDPEELGFKDTVKSYPNMDPTPPEVYSYVTRTIATFKLPWTSLLDYNWKTKSFGNWVYHCHILEHEENDMMRPFEVVQ
jgi:spore coat protein A